RSSSRAGRAGLRSPAWRCSVSRRSSWRATAVRRPRTSASPSAGAWRPACPPMPPLSGLRRTTARRCRAPCPRRSAHPDRGSRVAQLAESFRQVIPARPQRRLQELLGAAPVADYEELVERAHQSGRRVGMFLCGDFAYAARVALAESVPRLEDEPTLNNLHTIC